MSTDNEPPTDENRFEETVRTVWDDYDHPGTAVVERVSDVTGRDVTDLPLLQSTVDVDALEALLSRQGGTVQMTFRYADLRITISSDGRLMLQIPASPTV